MKKILISLFMMPIYVSAQEFILRNGDDVYLYNEKSKDWDAKPLPNGYIFNNGDSIKSTSSFTLEISSSWFEKILDFFTNKNRFHNYNPCPDGIRLNNIFTKNENKEKKDGLRRVDNGSVNMSVKSVSEDHALSEHLAWILINRPENSTMNVELEMYNTKNWHSISDSTFSTQTPVGLTVLNNEPDVVHAYIFSKDKEWFYFLDSTDFYYHIEPYSFYETEKPVHFSGFLGQQSVLLICKKGKLVNSNVIDSLISNKIVGRYHEEYKDSVGYKVINFNLIK